MISNQMKTKKKRKYPKMQTLSSVPKEIQNQITMDIKRYLKGEDIQMKEIMNKYDVTSFITQRLLRKEIGFDTKHNKL